MPECRTGGYRRIEQLATFPGLGRPGEVKGTRELVSPPYVLVYRSTEEIVEILHLARGARLALKIDPALKSVDVTMRPNAMNRVGLFTSMRLIRGV